MKKINAVLLGLGTAVAASALLAAGTYALFTDKVTVSNHLQAGTLKATLVRTAHSYSILDEKGYLKETKVENESVNSNDMSNAFELPQSALIVPQSKLSASFKIENNDTVAFDYSVEIIVKDDNGEPITFVQDEDYLADQLNVKLTGLSGTHTLSDSGLKVEGTEAVEVGQSVNFTFEMEFVDDDLINNLVQDKVCNFDLVVYATQAIN